MLGRVSQGFPGGSVVKNLPANEEATEDTGLIPGSERSPGGNGNLLQYSGLENSMKGGIWWAAVLGGREELDMLSTQLSVHAQPT